MPDSSAWDGTFFGGPTMRSSACRAPFALFLFLLLLPGASPAAPASDQNARCLACHARTGITLRFLNKEEISASLNAERLRASAHGSFACTACHPDFSGNHPDRTFKSKAQYRVKAALICRKCHSGEQIRRRPVHVGLLQKEESGTPPVCTNCHSAHAVTRVAGNGSGATEEQYCMTCHTNALPMIMKSGERKSMQVQADRLKRSVHGRLGCSDCHYGFSAEDHPRRKFRTARDFALASSENCRRCHFDKYTKTLEGIHYALLSQGQLNAPVCTDCHGSHDIAPMGKERSVSAKRCQRCHSAEYAAYAGSIHGGALFNDNNQDVPVCVDCHTAHTIQDPTSLDYRQQIPQMCSNCHARKEIVGKYGLSTDVVKTYLSDFHGVTLGLYRKQKDESDQSGRPIAVCTDCHGTHAITATTGPDASTVKQNLVKRCQKCHRDATDRFPDAWLSHYEPSLSRAPLVYLAGLAYTIIIPLMIVGLVLQILLHIWRYAINR